MVADLDLKVVHWSVVAAVLLLEVVFFVYALVLARRLGSADRENLAALFEFDIGSRAQRGQSPDWMHYRDEVDRLFESVDERLRALAAAALASGLGGTMLALLATFAIYSDNPTIAAGALIHGLGVALFGSFIGVVNHLLILLFVLPLGERRHQRFASAMLSGLRQISLENPPAEMFTRTLEKQLTALRRSLNSEFTSVFSTAIKGFPQVVEALGGHMDRLAAVVEVQARNSESAMAGVGEFSELVHDFAERFEPVARQLVDSTDGLLEMPEKLGGVLESGRNEWIDRLQEEQRQQRNELYNQVDRLRDTVVDIKTATSDLPERLATGVQGLFSDLAYDLEGKLSGHLRELRELLKGDRDLFVERTFQEWRNQVGEAVKEVLEQTATKVDGLVTAPLLAVANRIEDAAGSLPRLAERLETAESEWRQVHESALSAWQQAGEQIQSAAERLASGDASLREAVAALSDGAEQLERVARASGDFEATLKGILKEAVQLHYQELGPLHEEVGRMVEELRGTRGQFDGILSEQSAFIRRLITQILDGSEPTIPETSA